MWAASPTSTTLFETYLWEVWTLRGRANIGETSFVAVGGGENVGEDVELNSFKLTVTGSGGHKGSGAGS